jgi:hypothetical protein
MTSVLVSLKNGQFKIEENPFNFKLNMKKTRFTETQIVSILNHQESGLSVRDICWEHSIAEGTFYQWKNKYGGMVVQ